ncbi:MAG: filamentous hemagglutinin N-terminal domain-containing protein [Rhodospirillales bacterium]|nr:filamentous hemagglutinin N-terminal domain-containing protein [Rhodospirillales bacterium]
MATTDIRRKNFPKIRFLLLSTTALFGLLASHHVALAGPQGGTVVDGQATITQPTPKSTVINQQSAKAVINWQSFNIPADEQVTFKQPSSSAIALNRVTGGDPSQLLGKLTANGNVWIVNPNGVFFSKGAVIDVNGLLATTADIKTDNFRAGNFKFDIPGTPGATVINEGSITVKEGGIAVLVAPGVQNAGAIYAKLGKVGLGAGKTFSLDMYGDQLIMFEADAKMLDRLIGPDGKPLSDAIRNSGTISAEGGVVILTAQVAKSVVDNVINMDGVIKATSVSTQNGRIVLKGGDEGEVRVAGTLDASGKNSGEQGGSINITGEAIKLAGAKIDASGATGGGQIAVGNWQSKSVNADSASKLDASATDKGNGGSIAVIAQDTTFAGSASAQGGPNGGDGGQIETSGHRLEIGGAIMNLLAPRGRAGTWLLDPRNVYIWNSTSGGSFNSGNPNIFTPSADDSVVSASTINNVLNSGGSVTIVTDSGGSQAGNIYLWAGILKNSGTDSRLTLRSAGSIISQESISSLSGALSLSFTASGFIRTDGTTISTNGGEVLLTAGGGMLLGNIYTNGGNVNLNATGPSAFVHLFDIHGTTPSYLSTSQWSGSSRSGNIFISSSDNFGVIADEQISAKGYLYIKSVYGDIIGHRNGRPDIYVGGNLTLYAGGMSGIRDIEVTGTSSNKVLTVSSVAPASIYEVWSDYLFSSIMYTHISTYGFYDGYYRQFYYSNQFGEHIDVFLNQSTEWYSMPGEEIGSSTISKLDIPVNSVSLRNRHLRIENIVGDISIATNWGSLGNGTFIANGKVVPRRPPDPIPIPIIPTPNPTLPKVPIAPSPPPLGPTGPNGQWSVTDLANLQIAVGKSLQGSAKDIDAIAHSIGSVSSIITYTNISAEVAITIKPGSRLANVLQEIASGIEYPAELLKGIADALDTSSFIVNAGGVILEVNGNALLNVVANLGHKFTKDDLQTLSPSGNINIKNVTDLLTNSYLSATLNKNALYALTSKLIKANCTDCGNIPMQ